MGGDTVRESGSNGIDTGMNRAVAKRLKLSTATSQGYSGHFQSFIGLSNCFLLDKHKVDAGMGGDTVRESGSKWHCYGYE
jgi:hypothetical protein